MSVSIPNVTFCGPLRHQHGHARVANLMCRIKLPRLFVLEPSVIMIRSLKKVIITLLYVPQCYAVPHASSCSAATPNLSVPPAPLPFLPLGGAHQALISNTFSPCDAG